MPILKWRANLEKEPTLLNPHFPNSCMAGLRPVGLGAAQTQPLTRGPFRVSRKTTPRGTLRWGG
jgi:hypothetical protein